VTRTLHDTLLMPGQTVRLPGRTVTIERIVPPDSMRDAYEAELALARAQYADAMMRLSYYESLSAVADTTMPREMVLVRSSGERVAVCYDDELTLEYQYPPVNQFVIRTDTVRIDLPEEIVTVQAGLPWWAEVLIGLAGAAGGALLAK
jgi:hypothetical protein